METIGWDPDSYIIGGERKILVSGEFHYFRVPEKDWKRRLELFKEAGGNCVATYIPWLIHEPIEGDIRFGDVPERDLEGFLKLCKEMDLFVICRPGPYQYSELKYDGLPGWLCENYPEIQAQNIYGHAFRTASVSYLHPVFLEKVKKWYATVCPILAKYTLSKGGPMAFAQIDNEMMGIHVWYGGGWDYNKEAMGIGSAGGRYPLFLGDRYKTIDILNKAYGTELTGFDMVQPFKGGSPGTSGDRLRIKDYQEFYFDSIAEYGQILVKWMREAGIDCDIVHNSPNPASNSHYLELGDRLGNEFILGSDHYYNLGPGWEQNNPTPQYASKIFYSNEMLRLMGYPSTIFELPGGSASDWPPTTTEDFRCCYYTNIAFGMKGFNYYIFTGGTNPFSCGAFSDIYDYGASIGAGGDVRPLYDVQKEFGMFLEKNKWLAAAHRVSDFNIGLDWEYSRSHSYFNNNGGYEFNNSGAWEFMRQGMMVSGLCASYSPNLADISSDSLLEHTDKPLLIASSVTMAEGIQKRLVRFVKEGGKLMLAPVIPYLDDNFNNCTILKEFLENAEIIGCSQYAPSLRIGDVHNVYVNGGLFGSRQRPDGAATIAVEERSGMEIGWIKKYPAGGRVIWLGFHWQHSMHEHTRMIKFLLGELDCSSPVVECSNPNVWTSLRSDGERSMLFIMNLFSAPMEADIKVKTGTETYHNVGCLKLSPMEVKTIDI